MQILSRNSVGGATAGDAYDEKYIINILSEQAKLNLRYAQLFADQNDSKQVVQTNDGVPERQPITSEENIREETT